MKRQLLKEELEKGRKEREVLAKRMKEERAKEQMMNELNRSKELLIKFNAAYFKRLPWLAFVVEVKARLFVIHGVGLFVTMNFMLNQDVLF